MIMIYRLSLVLLFMSILATDASAIQVVTPIEGDTTYVDISAKELNVIKTNISNVKALSSSTRLDIKVDNKIIFVKYTGAGNEPQELILTSSSGEVYPLVLVPKGIPAETIVLRMREDTGEALKWEMALGQVKAVKELIKGMYIDVPPRGFLVEKLNEDRTEWKELSKTLIKRYNGAMLTGEVYLMKANTPVVLDEKEFHKKGILAVSLEKYELAPEETARLYTVTLKGN